MSARSLRMTIGDVWNNGRAALHNQRLRWRPADLDYVVFNLSGSLPEYIPPPPSWHKLLPVPLPGGLSGPSLSGLRNSFDQIAGDPHPVGVVLNLNGLEIGWATAQSLRDAIGRLRAAGKKIVAYASHFDLAQYFVAVAADAVAGPRSAMWEVAGLRTELTFLKDAFAAWGIESEIVNVSPYKTAWDTLARADISPEHRDMLNWMMDGRFESLVSAIATGRRLEPARVRELIDLAPLTAQAAHDYGLIDAVLYEDELPAYLGPDHRPAPKPRFQFRWPFGKPGGGTTEPAAKPKASLKRWSAARAALRRPIRWRSGKTIAVIPIEGAILPGRSIQPVPIPTLPIPLPIPLVDEPMAGAETVAQHLRDAEKDESVAAIVLNVNSPGGTALASDLIWREVERVRQKKPVVAYMGNVAASGGYYVAAPAHAIVAQPLTITGSIGVIALKFVTAGLYAKLRANRVVLKRGAHAGLFADDTPWTPELRAVAQQQTDAYYADFKKIVLSGRKLEERALEAVAGGRVWLGLQALSHKLIDHLGDLQLAIDKAKELAKVRTDRYTPSLWYSGHGGSLLPPPFPAPASSLADYARLLRSVFRERVWMIAPFTEKTM